MISWWFISVFIVLSRIKHLLGFEVQLIPQKIENDTNLNHLTGLLHNIPYLLPTINLCLGTPNQCFNLGLSTSNSFSVIESSDSKHLMFNNQFAFRKSSTFNGMIENGDLKVFLFGLYFYYLDGKISEDHLTIPNKLNQSTIPFRFVLGSSSLKLPNINFDGFIGMQKLYDDNLFFCQTEFSFLNYLKKSEFISKKTFVIEYNRKGGGRLLFGEEDYYSKHKTCNSSEAYYFQSKWDCSLTELSIGEETMKIQANANFESIQSFIYAPEASGGNFVIDFILKHYSDWCETQRNKNNTVIICDEMTKIEGFPDLILRMNETELVIQWINVFRLTEINGVKKYIGSFIVGNVLDDFVNHKYWTIGVPGFIDNSILFNHDENRVGIKYLKPGNQLDQSTISRRTSFKLVPLLTSFFLIVSLGLGLLLFAYIKIIRLKKCIIE